MNTPEATLLKEDSLPSGKTIPVRNPATGEIVGQIPEMGESEVLAAIAAAEKALKSPFPWDERRRLLSATADVMEAHSEKLARLVTLEQGKPLGEARVEVGYSAGFFRYYGGMEDPAIAERGTRSDGRPVTVLCRPAGVAALIIPWNFPLGMLAKKLAAAIAAGCPVVVKPSEETPLSCMELWKLHMPLGFPEGFLNLVLGMPIPIGEILTAHPAVRVISITGSTTTGKWIYSRCDGSLKRLALELGGNAPFLVFPDADIDLSVEEFLRNKFRCAGQTCVCANRLFLHRDIEELFLQKLAARMAKLRVGNGMEPSVDIGPLINLRAYEKACHHLEDALAKGARPVLLPERKHPESDWGCFFPPTLLAGGCPDMLAYQEETFAPLVVSSPFATEDEALDLANSTRYGLACYLFTSDQDRIARALPRLFFGHIGINTGAGPSPEFPFGGMKESGFGREGGKMGLHEYLDFQTVVGL